MDWQPIHKRLSELVPPPHLRDYRQTCRDFSWDAVRRKLSRRRF